MRNQQRRNVRWQKGEQLEGGRSKLYLWKEDIGSRFLWNGVIETVWHFREGSGIKVDSKISVCRKTCPVSGRGLDEACRGGCWGVGCRQSNLCTECLLFFKKRKCCVTSKTASFGALIIYMYSMSTWRLDCCIAVNRMNVLGNCSKFGISEPEGSRQHGSVCIEEPVGESRARSVWALGRKRSQSIVWGAGYQGIVMDLRGFALHYNLKISRHQHLRERFGALPIRVSSHV